MKFAVSLVCGMTFGAGLWISGMAQPVKVIGFFDVSGHWDPSLALVMVSAVATTALGYRVVLTRSAPLLAARFQMPTSKRIDGRLLAGSTIFGLGWGLCGYCPGPALVGLTLTGKGGLVFLAAMLAGLALVNRLDHLRSQATTAEVGT